MTEGITKTERDELAKLVRQRAKVAKAEATQRSAELLAEFERQIAAEYSFDDDRVWREAFAVLNKAAAEANERISAQCEELGIPKEFRPSVGIGWDSRGQNKVAGRRAELRKVAVTRLAALEKAARTSIERQSVEVQTQLIAGGLRSDEARAFLAAMPTPESLMPALSFDEISRVRLGPGELR